LLEVALPDTSLTDCSDLRQKTAKMGTIGRALAVFKVERVIVYKTNALSPRDRRDRDLLLRLLRYLDTPQYLRKRVFPHTPSLKYAGILPPLRTMSHPINANPSQVEESEMRWGIRREDGKVDIGLTKGIDYPHPINNREMVLFRIIRTKPEIRIEKVQRTDTEIYFGFEIDDVDNLSDYLIRRGNATRIVFSREGVPFSRIRSSLASTIEGTTDVVSIFGGPTHGVRELGQTQLNSIKDNIDFWVNTIPDQGTETVRLEEAMIASLALLNDSVGEFITKSGYHQKE